MPAVHPRPAGTVLLWPRGWAEDPDRSGRGSLWPSSHPWVGGAGLGVLSPSQNQLRVGCRREGQAAPRPHPQPASPFHPFCPRAPGNPEELREAPTSLLLLSGRTENLRGRPTRTARQLSPGPAVCFREEGLQLYLPTDDDHPCPTAAQCALRKTQRLPFCGHCFQGLERHVNTCDFSFPIKV